MEKDLKTFTDSGNSQVSIHYDEKMGNAGMQTDNSAISRELTFGQKLMDVTFNPSGDANVLRVKQLCAELADLIANNSAKNPAPSHLYNLIKGKALGEILNAQMNVVKLLTFKY